MLSWAPLHALYLCGGYRIQLNKKYYTKERKRVGGKKKLTFLHQKKEGRNVWYGIVMS
jgi:hypothetical protein